MSAQGHSGRVARAIEQQAALWLSRLDRGAPAPDQEAALKAWLAADMRHRAAFLRLRTAWRRAEQMQRLRPHDGEIDIDLLKRRRPGDLLRRFARPLQLAGAVGVAVAVIGMGTALLLARMQSPWETTTTSFAGFESMPLADGSTLRLNSDSEARVRMTAERRDVVLVRGEAHFEVAHDPRRVFEVEAGDARMRVTGTAFSVRLVDEDHVRVLVDAGRVAVALVGEPGAPEHALSAGHAATIGQGRVAIDRLAPAQVRRRLAWIGGQIVLVDDTLIHAVAEFNRYNYRQLVIAEPAVAGRRVGGAFKSHEVESFVRALERTHRVRAERTPGAGGRPGEIRLFDAGTKPRQREQ
jgi:transmembrane sensor